MPEGVIDELRSRRSSEENEYRVTQFQGKGVRGEYALLLFSQLPPSNWFPVVCRIFWPSRSYLQNHYSDKTGKSAAVYYVYHWFEIVNQLVWTIRNRFKFRNQKYV